MGGGGEVRTPPPPHTLFLRTSFVILLKRGRNYGGGGETTGGGGRAKEKFPHKSTILKGPHGNSLTSTTKITLFYNSTTIIHGFGPTPSDYCMHDVQRTKHFCQR